MFLDRFLAAKESSHELTMSNITAARARPTYLGLLVGIHLEHPDSDFGSMLKVRGDSHSTEESMGTASVVGGSAMNVA